MEFGLTEDQELLQRTARDFLERACPPGIVRAVAASASGVSQELERKIAEMGWTGLLVPESFGGLGLGMLDMAILLCEFGRAAVPGPFPFSGVLAASLIMRAGSSPQKKQWLPKLASGERTASLAWLEEADRLDPAGVQARGRRSGTRYRLAGKKLFVPYAGAVDLLITACRTAGRNEASGITLFLVDRGAPGVELRPMETIDGTRRVFEVVMRNVEVGADRMLGRAGAGWPLLERALDLGAVALAADALGGSERVLEMAVEYSKTREQFGRPIGSFQAMKHAAAEMIADIEPARSLLWYAAHAQDALPREATRAASMAKASLAEIYARSANRAVQMHGGIGFTWEHDLHFWFKRAKWNELAFGEATFHRERVAELGRY
jgi:alkylation response protein AidB-like acyl-CoA dehydrogenase